MKNNRKQTIRGRAWGAGLFPTCLTAAMFVVASPGVAGPNLEVPDIGTFAPSAQQQTVGGRVIDAEGNQLAGVSVSAGRISTQTDANGVYSIDVPANGTLTFSNVGYTTQRVSVDGRSTINVVLQPGDASLDEVVVIGYGTVRKRDLTGSVSSVSEKDFNKGVAAAPDKLIQGKSAGVMVMSNTGQPGGATTVRIRGTSSIRSGNSPLFVVDGIPLSGTAARPGTSGGDYGSDGGNPLNYLNPADIASIDILKDASATAIYGSRGANGVVLITTKRGQTGAARMNVQASTGVSSLAKKLEVLSPDEFRRALPFFGQTMDSDYGGNVDAFDAITRTSATQNYSVDVSGGNEGGTYRMSAGYLDQQGIILNSGMKKLTANLSGSFTFLESKRLGLDLGVLATHTDEQIAPVSDRVGAQGNAISQALQWNPTLALRQPDGSLTYQSVWSTNPLATLEAYKDNAMINTVMANIAPSYRFTDDLTYRFMYSLTHQAGRRTGRRIQGLLNEGQPNQGSAFIGNNNEMNHQLAHTLSFDRQVSAALHLNALLGYEYLSYDTRWNSMLGNGFSPVGGLDYYDYIGYSIANTRDVSSGRSPTNELQSYFARAGLNFRDKYLLTGTIRRDGSTKFGENNRYAIFPSLALAWNLHSESFLANSTLFSNLKLRAGWGKTGNSEFPSGASRDNYVFGMQSISQANYGNPNLKWESSATLNLGVDFGLFGNRLSGSVEYFDKKTTDALFEQTLAQPAPSGRMWVNLEGEIRNRGVEVALRGDVLQKEDWHWDLGLNATFLENSVSGLAGFYDTGFLQGQGFSNVRSQRMVNGQPLNVWYIGKFEGIDPATGLSLYRALDGRVGIDVESAANKYYMGSPNPKYLLGFSTNVGYKRLTATLNMNGAMGHYLFNNTNTSVLGVSNLPGRNIAKAFFDPSAPAESIGNSAAASDRYLEKGDYLKLSNLTLSYNLGTLARTFSNFNISLTGQNLLVLTGYTGFDPEVNTDGSFEGIPSLGLEYIPYPQARTFLLGVNFSL